jgi:hypothetical protein
VQNLVAVVLETLFPPVVVVVNYRLLLGKIGGGLPLRMLTTAGNHSIIYSVGHVTKIIDFYI